MKAYMIIATVNEKEYLTKVLASSESGAELVILNRSACGRHTYGVTACQAFDVDMMKTDHFRWSAIKADPVSLTELEKIIEARNAEIKAMDAAEDLIRENEKKIKELQNQIEEAKKVLA